MKRRRVSGFGGKETTDTLTTVAGVLAGNIGANMLGSSLLPSTMSGTAKGGILLVAGIALAVTVKDPLVKSVGYGVAVNGGAVLLGPTGLNVISGIRGARMGRIGRDGRYLADGVAGNNPKRYSVRPGGASFAGQTGVVAGIPKNGESDFNGNTDYNGNQDYK